VGPLVATLIGDLFGRKRLMLGNLLICAGGLLITIFSVDLVMAGVGLFLAMGGIQNAFNIEFYFITEKVSEISRTKYSVVIQLFFGIGVLLNVLWAFAVGDWKWILILFYLVPILIVILGIGLLIQDTPMCLVTKYSAEDALKSFKFISKLNKIQHFDLSAAEIA
jgi:MFS family permease